MNHVDREREIDGLYSELRSADDQEKSDRLRQLQEAEAREMAAFAEQRRQLPRDAVELIRRIDTLLEAPTEHL